MIGMTSKELFDSLAIKCQLLFEGKEHLHLAQGQEALGSGGGWGTRKFGGLSEDLHPSRPQLITPESAAVQELLPLSLAGLSQKLRASKALQKHPGRNASPILKGL